MRFSRILVALDGSEGSERVVPWMRRVLGGAGATVYLLTVKPPARIVVSEGRTVAYVDQAEDAARREALAALRPVAAQLAEDGIEAIPLVRFGTPAPTLLATAREHDVELIALASRGIGGIRRWWTRSVAGTLLRNESIPVLVVRRRAQRAA